MLLDNWLTQRAETCPDRVALIADGQELTYAELEREAISVARRLAAQGVRRDAVVVLELPAGLQHVVYLHALMKLGALQGTGTKADFDLAKFYIDERGRHSGGRSIFGEYRQEGRSYRQVAAVEGATGRGVGGSGPLSWSGSFGCVTHDGPCGT